MVGVPRQYIPDVEFLLPEDVTFEIHVGRLDLPEIVLSLSYGLCDLTGLQIPDIMLLLPVPLLYRRDVVFLLTDGI